MFILINTKFGNELIGYLIHVQYATLPPCTALVGVIAISNSMVNNVQSAFIDSFVN